jgi:death-on-curing protein
MEAVHFALVRMWHGRAERPKRADACHDAQLAQHGGLDGINDSNVVESAPARPQQLEMDA